MDLKSVLNSVAKPETIDSISKATGQDNESVKSIIEAGLPLILGKVEQNVSTKKGEVSLNSALDQHSDGSILDTLSGIFGGSNKNSDGINILGHIFGKSNDKAASSVAKKTGVDTATVIQVLSFIAPLVMAYMAQKRTSGGIKDTVKDTKDADGNPLIDLVGSVLGGGNKKSGGLLDGIIGSIFGKK